jgi:hypothetical protein
MTLLVIVIVALLFYIRAVNRSGQTGGGHG